MTLKNNRAPLLFYIKLWHHFVAIGEFKLELQSGKAQFGWNLTIFRAVWPWNLTYDLEKIGHLFYATSSFVHYFVAISDFKLELQSGNAQFGFKSTILEPCDLEIWRMTLKNNRAPLLCYFKLCASFCSHWWIQTGDTVRKRPIWVKFDDFFSRVTLKFDGWHWKIIGHLFNTTSSFLHHFLAIGEFKYELQSGNAQSGSNSTIFRAVWPWYLTDDLEKQ